MYLNTKPFVTIDHQRFNSSTEVFRWLWTEFFIMGIDNSNSQSEIFHRVNIFGGVKFEFHLDCLEITIVIFYSGDGFKTEYKSVVV